MKPPGKYKGGDCNPADRDSMTNPLHYAQWTCPDCPSLEDRWNARYHHAK